jgi:hypothetical protein
LPPNQSRKDRWKEGRKEEKGRKKRKKGKEGRKLDRKAKEARNGNKDIQK